VDVLLDQDVSALHKPVNVGQIASVAIIAHVEAIVDASKLIKKCILEMFS
jgi:hypothetical protein